MAAGRRQIIRIRDPSRPPPWRSTISEMHFPGSDRCSTSRITTTRSAWHTRPAEHHSDRRTCHETRRRSRGLSGRTTVTPSTGRSWCSIASASHISSTPATAVRLGRHLGASGTEPEAPTSADTVVASLAGGRILGPQLVNLGDGALLAVVIRGGEVTGFTRSSTGGWLAGQRLGCSQYALGVSLASDHSGRAVAAWSDDLGGPFQPRGARRLRTDGVGHCSCVWWRGGGGGVRSRRFVGAPTRRSRLRRTSRGRRAQLR